MVGWLGGSFGKLLDGFWEGLGSFLGRLGEVIGRRREIFFEEGLEVLEGSGRVVGRFG